MFLLVGLLYEKSFELVIQRAFLFSEILVSDISIAPQNGGTYTIKNKPNDFTIKIAKLTMPQKKVIVDFSLVLRKKTFFPHIGEN